MKVVVAAIMVMIGISSSCFAVTFDFASIPFEPGKAADEAISAKKILDDAAVAMKNFPKLGISIAGHTDTSECSDNDCFELSRRRAKFVADWLVAHGVERARINAVTGMGSGYPIEKNDSEKGRAGNRRVDIFPVDP